VAEVVEHPHLHLELEVSLVEAVAQVVAVD
jgi:hypothetical protein